MNVPSNWITYFTVVWAVLFVGMLVMRLARLRGRPGGLVEPRAEEIVFDESYASATSHKSTMTRMGGGRRCMRISVTSRAILVRPHFPFSLMGDVADLVHEIPLSAVTDITEFPAAGTSALALRFAPDRRVDLLLKQPAKFREAVSRGLANATKG